VPPTFGTNLAVPLQTALALRPFMSIRQSSKTNSCDCSCPKAFSSVFVLTAGQIAATALTSSAAKADR
jgi:hypothetical protein